MNAALCNGMGYRLGNYSGARRGANFAGAAGQAESHRHGWRWLNVHGCGLESLGGLPHIEGALLGHPQAGIPAALDT